MLRIARKLAQKSSHSWALHSAIVMRGGSVLSTGYNKDCRHAEVSALNKIWPNKRAGARLFSFRITPGGKWACAKPCPDCMKVIKASGIKDVWYTDREGKIQKMKVQ
jgi:deoxycytidylate deaminase